jgi:predicted lipoprotein with Yx(FWY)xxD motif
MMTITRRGTLRAVGAAAVAAVALVAAGCGSSGSSSTASAPAASSSSSSASAAPIQGVAISMTKGSKGAYLTSSSGRALYLWVADTGDKSNCAGACASVWPPLLTRAAPVASSGVNAADLGTTTRSDGTKQVTYKGHPLYYYVSDTGPRQTTGQGSNSFGAKWWLVAPTGAAITGGGSSTVASSGGSYSGGSSSSGSSTGSSSTSSGWG